MKVILLKDVKGTGAKDQILEVSDGFARNYLLPRKLAVEADAAALNAIENAKKAAKHKADQKRDQAEAAARDLKGKVIQLTARSGEGGRLYGSITNAEIAAQLQKQHGVSIDKQKIELDEPIRRLGQASVTIRLSAGVATRMVVNVTAEE